MILRTESQRDGQTLAPDAIRGTGSATFQALAGRQNHPYLRGEFSFLASYRPELWVRHLHLNKPSALSVGKQDLFAFGKLNHGIWRNVFVLS